MDGIDKIIATLKAENKRLQNELKSVRIAIAALQGSGANGAPSRATGNGLGGRKPRHRMSAAARRSISQAQKARWAKWKAKHKG